jgi:hypothetical protein
MKAERQNHRTVMNPNAVCIAISSDGSEFNVFWASSAFDRPNVDLDSDHGTSSPISDGSKIERGLASWLSEGPIRHSSDRDLAQ